MDQKKIGQFIALLRKEKKLTQLELADKLGISDRAISKWENGRGMPDISLIKPLCEELDISINELLSGERIAVEEYQERLEDNILTTIEDSEKHKKKYNKFKFVMSGLLVGVLVIVSVFIIDITRMSNHQEVFFSTWGIDYFPPVNLSDERIELTIKEYIIEQSKEYKRYDNQQTFVSMKTFLIEEKTSTKKDTLLYYVYTWILEEAYYENNDTIEQARGSSIPHKIEIEYVNDTYTVINSTIPRDGSYYSDDMKILFPLSVRNSMNKVYQNGTIERLSLDIQEQVKLYFHK